jgi:hypothetical protein
MTVATDSLPRLGFVARPCAEHRQAHLAILVKIGCEYQPLGAAVVAERAYSRLHRPRPFVWEWKWTRGGSNGNLFGLR